MDQIQIAAIVRNAYAELEASRPRTIFLTKPIAFDDGAVKNATQRKTMVGRCAATNLSGSQCNSKAAHGCGRFCKRHMPTPEMLDQL